MNLCTGTFLLVAAHFWASVAADSYQLEVPPLGAGMSATESSVWENHVANLAIDGQPGSWAAMVNGNANEPAWWRVDLGANYLVTHVKITNTADSFFSAFLENFRILLENERNGYGEQQCYRHPYAVEKGNVQIFQCDKPTEARYVKIIKDYNSVRRDIMAIADVKVFTTVYYNVPPNTPSPVIPPSNIVDPNSQQMRELQLSNYQVEQKGTFGNHHAFLAIDNNPSTYTIACGDCDHTLNNEDVGWWMIDLQKSEPISRVVLTSSIDHYNSKYMQEIEIWVSQTKTNLGKDGQLCFRFNNRTELPPGSVLTFNCDSQPTWGRYLFVDRIKEAYHRPDAMSIAEIKIFTSTSNSIVNIDKNSNSNFASLKSQMIQSGTWGGHEAYLAMDGNMETYSVADTTLDSKATYYNKPAWWQLDLGANRWVSAVSIASSSDDTNARYLEEFAIEISRSSIEIDSGLLESRRCKYYKGGYKTRTTTRYECDQGPLFGRYVIIRRLDAAVNSYGSYRPQVIALAEVQVHLTGS